MSTGRVYIEILPGGRMPTKAHETDAAFDCYAASVDFPCAGVVRCGLGFRLELPEGWFADLRPRSSLYKTGLVLSNSCGVVDAGYRGEIQAFFYTRPDMVVPQVGDRVIQMLLRRLDDVRLIQVEAVNPHTSRGTGGFGSTGR